ncbi:transcriptional regulator with XRE-family HTH domain [Bacillus pakistanensis]|uniref:Transcriptional regulator with XRE-family HTH domain n=1 Tax=Rossellomorea pakistanensis TaxID=992288 RepID=A0ABS2NBU4_9BACI|nr:tetratricopeptide repeat protein [Bacillus pakistanensis]MBM7585321.1 transcriptional regulator with XRE-family HTH domain [Bacillus pakistanensis]
MDFSAVGKKIKELRKNVGLSQEDLAEGICTQAQISKIEKGIVYPYASTLYLISQKLGVDVNYFFDIGMTPRLDYVQEVEYQLKVARRTFDYQGLKQIVQAEENNPLFFQNKVNLQLLLWHKGIYIYELEKDIEKTIKTLKSAVELTRQKTKVFSEREIEIQISLGIIYFRYDIEKAVETYMKINDELQMLPTLNDYTIKTRLYYNYARALTRLSKLEESIRYCEQAINWCIEKENMFLLGELHYHIGYNYELQGDLDKAITYMKKALTVFELQRDDKYIKFISEKIKEMS